MANGQALVIVGESTLEQAVDKAELKADKHVAKELNTRAEASTRPSRKPPPKSADPPIPGPGMAISPRKPKRRHLGGHMRATYRPGTRTWLVLPAAVLVLSALAAGCSSSKPAYCTAASQLKTSVQDLGNITVNVHDLSSVNTAVSKVSSDAKTFAADAKSAYPSQTTALNDSLSGLQTAIKSAQSQPSLTTVAAVVSSITQVKTSANNLQNAAAGKCQ